MAEVIALDFDGVICDGLDECLLVSWLSFADRVQPSDGIPLLDTIPSSFKDRFARCRNFVRHSGHFIIPFLFECHFRDAGGLRRRVSNRRHWNARGLPAALRGVSQAAASGST